MADWQSFFNTVKPHPPAFYASCASALEAQDFYAPSDVVEADISRDDFMRAVSPGASAEVVTFLGEVFDALVVKFATGGATISGAVDIVEDTQEDLAFPYLVGPFTMATANLVNAYNAFHSAHGTTMGIPKPDPASNESCMTGLDPGVAGFGRGADMIFCQLSPLHRITLDDETKALANIPRAATTFAWAYPIVQDPTNPLTLNDRPEGNYCTFGGYCYFDDSRNVVGTNAICPANLDVLGLMFGRPHLLDAESTSTLTKQGRFQDITIPMMTQKGATHFAWIRPGEFPDTIAAPDGAFAYKFGPPSDGKPKYYPVVSKPTYTTDMKNEELDSEEAWVCVRGAGRRPQIELLKIFNKSKSFDENCSSNELEVEKPIKEVVAYKERNPTQQLKYEEWRKCKPQGNLTQPWILEVIR